MVRLSTSIRNWPLVTTVSPAARPSRTCTLSSSPVRPVRTRLGEKCPSPSATNAICLVPLSITASRGQTIASFSGSVTIPAVAYIPGFSSKSGLSSVARNRSVRLMRSRFG